MQHFQFLGCIYPTCAPSTRLGPPTWNLFAPHHYTHWQVHFRVIQDLIVTKMTGLQQCSLLSSFLDKGIDAVGLKYAVSMESGVWENLILNAKRGAYDNIWEMFGHFRKNTLDWKSIFGWTFVHFVLWPAVIISTCKIINFWAVDETRSLVKSTDTESIGTTPLHLCISTGGYMSEWSRTRVAGHIGHWYPSHSTRHFLSLARFKCFGTHAAARHILGHWCMYIVE